MTIAIARAAANLVQVESQQWGDWPWLQVLDAEDLATFVNEMQEAIVSAAAGGTAEPIETLLNEWQVTAGALKDPEFRELMSRPHKNEDFVEVMRPSKPA